MTFCLLLINLESSSFILSSLLPISELFLENEFPFIKLLYSVSTRIKSLSTRNFSQEPTNSLMQVSCTYMSLSPQVSSFFLHLHHLLAHFFFSFFSISQLFPISSSSQCSTGLFIFLFSSLSIHFFPLFFISSPFALSFLPPFFPSLR